jgi:hypothetical protein
MPLSYMIKKKPRKLDMVDKPCGVYRIPSIGGIPACVWVEDDNGATFKIAEERYRLNAYKPDIDELPSEEEYEAARNA